MATVTHVPSCPDPEAVSATRTALVRLRLAAESVEEELFTSLAVTGDPRTQRGLDAWVDTAVDAVRAIRERASEQEQRLAVRSSGREAPARGVPAQGVPAQGIPAHGVPAQPGRPR